MKKHYVSFICLVAAALAVLMSDGAYAAAECVNTLEPGLQQMANTPPTPGANNQLQGQGAGVDIINGIFAAVDAIVAGIARSFYTAVVQNPDYIAAVNSLIVLYVAVYGIMLLFNIASHKTAEVVGRMFKIAIVYAIMINGWGFFNQYIGTPVLASMNQIIANFITASGGNAGPDSVDTNTGALNPVSVSLLAGPMTLIFSMRFVTAILALLSTGPFGWFFVLVILWSMLEFILMLIGAIITYIKSIVGLSFLFGIAPIFFAFILFEQSKRVFLGWANQVFGFFLLPVLLFAFLSFYIIMILNALETILFPPNTDICHVVWLHFGIVDIWWWRFINAQNTLANPDPNGTWQGAPPIGIMDILYLLLLTHLGKNLSKFIEHLARDLSGGTGPGMTRGSDVGRWFSNHIPGVQGRGIAGVAAAMGGNMLFRGRNLADRTGVTGKVTSLFKRGNPNTNAATAGAKSTTETANPANAPKFGPGTPGPANPANPMPRSGGVKPPNDPSKGTTLAPSQARGAEILGQAADQAGRQGGPTAAPSTSTSSSGSNPAPSGSTTTSTTSSTPPASGSSGTSGPAASARPGAAAASQAFSQAASQAASSAVPSAVTRGAQILGQAADGQNGSPGTTPSGSTTAGSSNTGSTTAPRTGSPTSIPNTTPSGSATPPSSNAGSTSAPRTGGQAGAPKTTPSGLVIPESGGGYNPKTTTRIGGMGSFANWAASGDNPPDKDKNKDKDKK